MTGSGGGQEGVRRDIMTLDNTVDVAGAHHAVEEQDRDREGGAKAGANGEVAPQEPRVRLVAHVLQELHLLGDQRAALRGTSSPSVEPRIRLVAHVLQELHLLGDQRAALRGTSSPSAGGGAE
eukprot:7541621-Pyramimonas_sp.AAC.1